MDEASLVEQAQRGDHAAFSTLVSIWGQTLFGVALRITSDPAIADDAVQETIIAAWRELPRLRQPDRVRSWLIRIVVRTSSRMMKSRPATTQLNALGMAALGTSGVDQLAERDAMERAFGRISPSHRAVLVLRYYLDLETQEIAPILGIPAGTVRSRLHYAIEAMRAALGAEERSSREMHR